MKRLLLAVAIAAFAALFVSPIAGQKKSGDSKHGGQARPRAALILGRVVDASSNQPVSGATVVINASSGARGQSAAPGVLTTDNGYFLFRDLPAGAYEISAGAPGYLSGGLGQRRAGGATQPFTITEGQRAGDLTIRLWKESTLSGTVRDEAGDPISGIALSLLRRSQLAGATAFRTGLYDSTPMAWTDSGGAYQFSGLLPGEYIVSIPSRTTQLPATLANADGPALEAFRASGLTSLTSGLRSLGPTVRVNDILIQTSAEGTWGGSNTLAGRLPITVRPDGVVLAYASTFFPGVQLPSQATAIELQSGEDRAAIDFRLRPVPLGRVVGRLSGPGGPVAGMAVHLIPAFANNTQLERSHATATTVSTADGAFTFLAVPSGDYVVKSWKLPPSLVIAADALPAEPTLWGSQVITVSDRPTPAVALSLSEGAQIRGRLVFEGTAKPLPPARFQTMLSVAFEAPWSLAFGARLSVRVTPAYEFSTQGLPPGAYFPVMPNQFAPDSAGWFFESITRDGRDVMIDPIVLEPGRDATDIVITFTDKRTRISGTVTDATGKPSASGGVVVMPANPQAWIERGLPPLASWSVAASQAGTYELDVRPGEYLVVAIEEARLADWRRAPFVSSLAKLASRVTIARGETQRRDLIVMGVKAP